MVAEWYGAYTRSAHWRRVKARLREERERFCEICERRWYRVVHHKTYAHLGCEPSEDLQLLCKICHKALHVGLLHSDGEIEGIGVIRKKEPPVGIIPLLPMTYIKTVMKRGSW